ncbi:unnamed protein product [Boreogadus saida]
MSVGRRLARRGLKFRSYSSNGDTGAINQPLLSFVLPFEGRSSWEPVPAGLVNQTSGVVGWVQLWHARKALIPNSSEDLISLQWSEPYTEDPSRLSNDACNDVPRSTSVRS